VSTLRDTTKVFLGNAASSVLAIIFTIVAARALGPESWGLVAAVGSFVGILTAIGELGLDAALLKFVPSFLKEGKTKEAKEIFGAVFALRAATSVFLFVVIMVSARVISPAIFGTSDPRPAVFAGIMLFGGLIFDFQIASVQAKQSWSLAAAFLAFVNFFRIVGFVVLSYFGKIGFIPVLAIFSLSPLISFLFSVLFLRPAVLLDIRWKKTAGLIGSFSGWMSLNKIASSVNSRIDVLLLINLAGAHEAGIYAAAGRLAMGVPLIIGSFATVLAPRFSSIDSRQIGAYFKKTMALAGLMTAGLIFGIFVSPLVISLFGVEYESSRPILQLLLVSFVPFVLATPAVNLLIYGFKEPKIITATTIFQLPFILAVNFYFIPRIGALAPVISIAAINTSTLLVSYFFVWQKLRRIH